MSFDIELSSIRLSVLTITAAILARCHWSWNSTSQSATLKERRTRSVRLESIRRLSLSDRLSPMKQSSRISPTVTGDYCPASRTASDFLDTIGLDDVTDLDVESVLNADAAFIASIDFLDVVLEPTQRADLTVQDNLALADDAG